MLKRYFKPTLFSTLIVLLSCALLIALGCWQLERAIQKRALRQKYTMHFNMPPLTLSDIKIQYDQKDLQYRRVRLQGYFDNQHQFLLDNKFYQHKIGYHVVTPFIPTSEQTIVLINRGWIMQEKTRLELPLIKLVSGKQTIEGMIIFPPTKHFLLGNHVGEKVKTGLYRIQQLDLQYIKSALGQPVFPFVVQLAPNQKYGFTRDWQIIIVSEQRHIAYAIQWFVLAIVLLIIFVVANLKR